MEVQFFPLSVGWSQCSTFLVWGNSGKFLPLGEDTCLSKHDSWKALVSAGTHVALAPLGAQVNSVTRASRSSISYSGSPGRLDYTEKLGRRMKSEISTGSSDPSAWGFSQSHFCWRQLMFNLRSRNCLSCSCWSTAYATSHAHFKETNFQEKSLSPSGASSSCTAELSWKKNQ